MPWRRSGFALFGRRGYYVDDLGERPDRLDERII
jgi:hypothetical protein